MHKYQTDSEIKQLMYNNKNEQFFLSFSNSDEMLSKLKPQNRTNAGIFAETTILTGKQFNLLSLHEKREFFIGKVLTKKNCYQFQVSNKTKYFHDFRRQFEKEELSWVRLIMKIIMCLFSFRHNLTLRSMLGCELEWWGKGTK